MDKCSNCKGTGKKSVYLGPASDHDDIKMTCMTCGGSGKAFTAPQYGPSSDVVLYGVNITPTEPQPPWVPWIPSHVKPILPDTVVDPIHHSSVHRENAMKTAMWYAACLAMPKEHDRINAEKPCKLSEAIAALEWVRDNMTKLPAITDRQLTVMWFSGAVVAP